MPRPALAPLLRLALLAPLLGCASDSPLSPATGPQDGGTEVRIQGDGFVSRGPVLVYFGQEIAKAIVIDGETWLRARAPKADEATTVDVTLLYADGSRTHLPAAFTYEAGQTIVVPPQGAP